MSVLKYFVSILLLVCGMFMFFQSAIETLIRICRHPPRPDAVCRSAECQNKSQIYLTDTGGCSSIYCFLSWSHIGQLIPTIVELGF